MDVNIDASSRVFFFIKKTEDLFGEVLVPDMAGISINKVRNKNFFVTFHLIQLLFSLIYFLSQGEQTCGTEIQKLILQNVQR